MSETGLLFPGQGSQSVGMVKGLSRFSEARDLFERARARLGFDLWELCLSGPEEVLSEDFHAQLAVYVTNCAFYSVLQERLKPSMASGFSLGIFSAFYAAGSFTFEQGLDGVHYAAERMSQEAKQHPGAMVAVIGLSEKEIQEISSEFPGVFLASVNNAQQMVISGMEEEIEKAIPHLVSRGALLVKRLPIGWAIHTPFMESVSRDFSHRFREWEIAPPRFPVVSYLRGEFLNTPEEIKAELANQFSRPNRWQSVLIKMGEEGIETYVEVGPGNVLSGMVRWVHRPANVLTAEEILAKGGLGDTDKHG